MQTPRLIVDKRQLTDNIRRMQEAANLKQVNLRPHIKAHKCPDIMQLQLAHGAKGITVAKLGEAEIMAAAGANDIFIAYQLVGPDKLHRLQSLARRARVSVAVDNMEQAENIADFFTSDSPLEVLIEVDTGLKRCGVVPADVLSLAGAIVNRPSLKLKGIFTHAGQVYGAAPEQVEAIGVAEAQTMVNLYGELKNRGINIDVVSTGSTPTALHNLKVAGVNEIRPGNYVFYDAIQIGLGVASLAQCALQVEATVISTPAPDRCVIDAGSKVFGLDKGAHGTNVVTGFGRVIGHPELTIERLSEEHGVLTTTGELPKVGERLYIIPNHACVVVNLADRLYIRDSEEAWPITARGRVD